MIKSVRITGYRALSDFEMSDLGRVNLLVGKNNSGKTSVLEAIYLLATGADPTALWRVMTRRGEQLVADPTRNSHSELDVCHLFYGHEIKLETTATISTTNQSPPRSISFKITGAKREDNPALFAQIPHDFDGPSAPGFAVSITGNPTPLIPVMPLSARGGVRPETIQVLNNMALNAPRVDRASPQYVSTESLSLQELTGAWNTISLTPDEKRVTQALQIMEPRLEQIATAAMGPFIFGGFPIRGGFKAKLKGSEQPIPIGSLGEGTWRMLAMAISLSRSKGTLLLIDEIDTGLHYTVMKDMWKLVAETAKESEVQVFATTHSNDCVKSLASICSDDVRVGSQVTIQRIEAGSKKAVAYSEAEITVAAEQNIEVR